jgi:hypothetical protein
MLATALGQEFSVTFANERYAKLREESKPHDKFVIFALSGQTDSKWTKHILFHSFAESGNDVAKGVGDLVKWIKQRDKNARFGVLEKKEANETIVDFLLLPSGNDKSVGFHVLRYAAATDGKGLVAAHYLLHFDLGEFDADDLKRLRREVIEAMARFDMQPVKAYFAGNP